MANLELIILIVAMRQFTIRKKCLAMGVLKKMNVSTFDEGQKAIVKKFNEMEG